MKKSALLLLTAALSVMALSGCFGSDTPSGPELFEKASDAAAEQKSFALQATLEGQTSEGGKTVSGSLEVEAQSDTRDQGNAEIKVGDDFLLAQVGSDTYFKTDQASLRISSDQITGQATEDTPLEVADQAILLSGLNGLFAPIDAEAEVADGPTIDGQETWAWKPNLADIDLRETLLQGLDAATETAQQEGRLPKDDQDEVASTRADIDSLGSEDLEKAKIVGRGIDLEIYFAKSSGLHLGSDLRIGWTAEELRQVFGSGIDVTGAGSVEAGVSYRLAWSTETVEIVPPADAVSTDSPAGRKQIRALLSDLGPLGLLLGAVEGQNSAQLVP